MITEGAGNRWPEGIDLVHLPFLLSRILLCFFFFRVLYQRLGAFLLLGHSFSSSSDHESASSSTTSLASWSNCQTGNSCENLDSSVLLRFPNVLPSLFVSTTDYSSSSHSLSIRGCLAIASDVLYLHPSISLLNAALSLSCAVNSFAVLSPS